MTTIRTSLADPTAQEIAAVFGIDLRRFAELSQADQLERLEKGSHDLAHYESEARRIERERVARPG